LPVKEESGQYSNTTYAHIIPLYSAFPVPSYGEQGTGTDLLTAVGDVRFPRAGTDSRLHLAESIAATGLGCDCHVAVLEEGSSAPKQLFLKTIGRKPLLHPISVNFNRVQEGMAS
jgi:hypothetical protein